MCLLTSVLSDDGSLPADSKNAAWGPMFYKIGAEVTGRPMDMCYTMKDNILAAGFTNLQEKAYKIPVGTWPKHPIFKEAGRLYYKEVSAGLEVSKTMPPFLSFFANRHRDMRTSC